MSQHDTRSVGELLLDSEHIARGVLMDVDQIDGRTMLRTWGELVQSAGDLWQALPKAARNPLGGDAHEPGDALMEQLQGISRTMLRTHKDNWPGDGPTDPRLLQISGNLLDASELVTHHRDDVRPMRPEVREDLSAAKARLMHTLYIASHGVNVALGRDIRDLTSIWAEKRHFTADQSLVRSRRARERVTAFEQLAGSYVSRNYPAALGGEHKPNSAGSRLGQALASFDVQVHRTLGSDVRGVDLMVTAQSQALIMLASQAMLRAGAATGAIDSIEYRSRLSPALEDAQSNWAGLASTWRALTPPSARRLDPNLSTVVNEARASIMDIIHDRATLASPDVLASRVDLANTASTIQNALSAAVDQAHLVQEVTREQNLTGSARAVNTMAMDVIRDRPAGGVSEKAWVSPRELLSNRLVPLPMPVREAMNTAATQTAEAASRAMSAASFLDRPLQGDAGSTQLGRPVRGSPGEVTPPRLTRGNHEMRGPRR